MSYWNSILTEALQGDKTAIEQVAQRLEQGPTADDETQREEFLAAVAAFKSEYQDVCDNAESYERVIDLDSKIARSHPHLNVQARLRIAGAAVRSGGGGPAIGENADRSMAIQEMRRTRRMGVPKPKVFESDDDSEAISRMGRREVTGLEENT